MVMWAQTTRRTISQQTFDEAVQDNINDFEMTLQEAIEEARNQFAAQGVDLTGIRDTTLGEQKSVMDELNGAIAAEDEDKIMNVLQAISDDEARGLADQGLIGALFFICRQHREQKPVVIATLNALVICTKSSSPSSTPEPGLVSLLQCLQHHRDDSQIQSYGLKVVAQVIGGFEPYKITIYSNGFNDYICDILSRYHTEPGTFVRACNVVKRYLSDDDRRPGVHPHTFTRARELADKSEIISTMISALKQNSKNPTYVAAICSTLRCIAVTDAICLNLSHNVLPGELIQIAKLHLNRDDIAEKVFSLLKIMSRNDNLKVSLCCREGLELTVMALEQHASNQKTITQVLGMLSAITLRQPENCITLANNGVIPLIVTSMASYPDHIAIQRGAISTLRNMVSSSRTKELANLILEENAEELICKAHDAHEQCKDVAYAALRDLGRPYKATWSGIDS